MDFSGGKPSARRPLTIREYGSAKGAGSAQHGRASQTGPGIAVNNGTVALTHPDYNDSAAQYVNPTTASGNQFAEQLQLYRAASAL